jgi:two-component system chemotaxis sensor kinase CheA
VKLKIPLTLAIVPALIVQCGRKRFAIPQVSLIELVRLEAEQVRTGIELVHGVPVYRLRGRLLPLVYLARELKLPKPAAGDGARLNIVVLQADDRQFGLLVDEIKDTEEIVVKPLGKQLKGLKVFAGATIMGDGKVALILDVLGLAQSASIISEVRDRALAEAAAAEAEAVKQRGELQSFLLFAGPDDARMALPLSELARLEEIPAAQIEKSGVQWVVQYRGQILPLIRLSEALEERRHKPRHVAPLPPSDASPVPVLVLNHEGQHFGIVVDKILDVTEASVTIKSPATRSCILYSAVIADRVTELIDIPAILRAAELSGAHPVEQVEATD